MVNSDSLSSDSLSSDSIAVVNSGEQWLMFEYQLESNTSGWIVGLIVVQKKMTIHNDCHDSYPLV